MGYIMKNKTIFNERLLEAMKAKSLTQKKLAELLNVNQTSISRWINGNREPDYNTLLLLCAYLDESPNELLGYDEKDLKQWAYHNLKVQVANDIDFKCVAYNTETVLKNQGASKEEIDKELKQIFDRILAQYCEHYNFNP